jgi:hypothetical protein
VEDAAGFSDFFWEFYIKGASGCCSMIRGWGVKPSQKICLNLYFGLQTLLAAHHISYDPSQTHYWSFNILKMSVHALFQGIVVTIITTTHLQVFQYTTITMDMGHHLHR